MPTCCSTGRLLGTVLAAFGLVMMAGCGGTESTPSAAPPTLPVATETTAEPAPTAAVTEPPVVETTMVDPSDGPDTDSASPSATAPLTTAPPAPEPVSSTGELSALVTIDGTSYVFGDPELGDVVHFAFCLLKVQYDYLGAELFALDDDGGLTDGVLDLDLQPTDSAGSDGISHVDVTFENGPSYSFEGELEFDLDESGASGALPLTSSDGRQVDATFEINC
jgi:hypothetical protein